MSTHTKHSNEKDATGSDKSAAKRAVEQESQDAIRHREDASHHKGTQQGGDDGSTGQQSQGGSGKNTGGIPAVASDLGENKSKDPAHKGGSSK